MSWSARRYDQVATPQTRWGSEVAQRLLAELDGRPAPLVLDAGCGTGRLTEQLLQARPDLSAIAADLSSEMLATAAERLARFGQRASTLMLDLSDLSAVPDELGAGVDAVFSTGTFHWVPEPAPMYAALADLLKPGGCLVAQCGGEGSLLDVRTALDELDLDWRSFNRYSGAQETKAWLTNAGFEAVWTWVTSEPVEFPGTSELAAFLQGGALSPYLAHLGESERREVAWTVAQRLGEPRLTFTRLNMLARHGPLGCRDTGRRSR